MSAAILMLLVPAILGDAADVHRSGSVAIVQAPPTIDGILDEACWSAAPELGALRQMSPLVDAAATERTEVRILRDERFLYLGVRCHDSTPAAIVATQMARDAELDPDDRLELYFDTFHDRRNAFYFQISAAGSRGDALLSRNGNSFNKPWDGIWEGRTTIDEHGWSAEIAIPFQTLAFEASNDVWGFNVNRVIRRRDESSRWSGFRADQSFFQISEAGDLAGLRGAKQGLGLDVVPFYAGSWSHDHASEDSTLEGEPGLDVFYRITPNLQASLTWNTDFAETEVDSRRINLTRFPLFFPEKRDFFLRDATVFDFADLDKTLVPFFSRRIGLDAEGQEVPILGGVKLAGRAGDWSVGVLDVQTEGTPELASENLFVTRVARNVGEQSSVGGIFTQGDPTGVGTDQLYGLDANFRTSSFRDNKNLNSSVWGLRNESSQSSGDDLAYGASLRYPNDIWRWALAAREVQENFSPKLGFVPRNGIRAYDGNVEFRPRIDSDVRRLEFEVLAHIVTDTSDRLETSQLELKPLGIVFDSDDEVAFALKREHEVLDEPFEIEDGITLPTGTYDTWRAVVTFESSLARPVSVKCELECGEFYSGTSVDSLIGMQWRASRYFQSAIEWDRSDVDLDEGMFVTHVGRARADFAFSPEMTWTNFVQVDNETDTLGVNSRFRWTFEPGRDFFLVLNETVEREDGAAVASEQRLSFKFVYTLRF